MSALVSNVAFCPTTTDQLAAQFTISALVDEIDALRAENGELNNAEQEVADLTVINTDLTEEVSDLTTTNNELTTEVNSLTSTNTGL